MLGYAFMPITYLIGIVWEDAYLVGELLSDKCFGMSIHVQSRIGLLNLGNLIRVRPLIFIIPIILDWRQERIQ